VSNGNAAALVAMAVVPLLALMLSAFVKTSVVMSLLRNALGAPQAPPIWS
jgi:type III secretory pathway component EscR